MEGLSGDQTMNRVFAGMAQFAAFMARSRAVEFAADTAGRAAAAQFIMERVRERIGHEDLLPPPLAPSTQEERERLGYSSDETLLREGDLQESYLWDHETPIIARHTVVGSADPKALYHEFGVEDAGRNHATVIPARAPLASTMTDHDPAAFEIYVRAFVEVFDPI
jgi:phage gpG-like protein